MGSRMDPTKVARNCLSEASSLRKRQCPHGLALHLLQPMDLYMKELTLAHILEETVSEYVGYLCQGELGKVEVWTLWDPENLTFEIPTGSQNTSRNRAEKCIFHFSPQVLNIETSFHIQSTPLGRTNRMVYSCTGAYSVVEHSLSLGVECWNDACSLLHPKKVYFPPGVRSIHQTQNISIPFDSPCEELSTEPGLVRLVSIHGLQFEKYTSIFGTFHDFAKIDTKIELKTCISPLLSRVLIRSRPSHTRPWSSTSAISWFLFEAPIINRRGAR